MFSGDMCFARCTYCENIFSQSVACLLMFLLVFFEAGACFGVSKICKRGSNLVPGGAPSPADWASLRDGEEVELKCTDSDMGLGLRPGLSFPHCVQQVKGGASRFYAGHCPLLVTCSLGQVGGGWPAATLRRLRPVGDHPQPPGGWVSESPGW